MKQQTFDDYLREIHYELYPQLLDDDLPDAFNRWISEVDVDDLLTWAELYGKKQFIQGSADTLNKLDTNLHSHD